MIKIQIEHHPTVLIGMMKDEYKIYIPQMKYIETISKKEFIRLHYIATSLLVALNGSSKNYREMKQHDLIEALLPYISKSHAGGPFVQVDPITPIY